VAIEPEMIPIEPDLVDTSVGKSKMKPQPVSQVISSHLFLAYRLIVPKAKEVLNV